VPLRNSHIISETFWEAVYDDKHRALPMSTDIPESRIIQKGLREELLCGDCEAKLSKWENILKQDLVDLGSGQSNYLTIKPTESGMTLVQGIRYSGFKLGVLSILWRMSITSDPYYASYDLGKKYEEILRLALYNEAVPQEKQFPIMMDRYELDGAFLPGLIMGFPPGKLDELFTVQAFVIWGYLFSIVIVSDRFPKVPIELFLRKSGEALIQTRNLVELASPDSVLSKIFDPRMKAFFAKGQQTPA
jgi:hypothetical protein